MSSGETESYNVIGLMSGTSLDGLDVAACIFHKSGNNWQYEIVAAETFGYDQIMRIKLSQAHNMSGVQLAQLHIDLGLLHGSLAKAFFQKHNFKPDFISSHGHTVFHQPEIKLTLQISSPAHIASICNKTVIADFRSQDVARGGQGAPLVPVDKQARSPHNAGPHHFEGGLLYRVLCLICGEADRVRGVSTVYGGHHVRGSSRGRIMLSVLRAICIE